MTAFYRCQLAMFAWIFTSERPTLAAENRVTFNRDVAPIIFTQCVVCHHPGGTGPFSFTTYHDVKRRAKVVAEVITTHYMPPWLPEAGHGEFVGERRLSDEQIAT